MINEHMYDVFRYSHLVKWFSDIKEPGSVLLLFYGFYNENNYI